MLPENSQQQRQPLPEAFIRPAAPADCDKIADLANKAYSIYLERMDKKPAPMTENYAARIAEGFVFVLEIQLSPALPALVGFIMLVPDKDALLLRVVTVDPAMQGQGYGKMLIAFAEKRACELGLHRISLFTNEVMTENLRLYPRLGYTETHRASENGFNRVYFSKALSSISL